MSIEQLALQVTTFEYDYLPEEDIHIVTFLESSRKCVDEFIEFMTEFYVGLTDDDHINLLVDYRRSGMPPVTYVLRRGVRWANNLTAHPSARVAFVHNTDFVVGMFGALLNSLRYGHLKTQFFDGDGSYQKAMAWLNG